MFVCDIDWGGLGLPVEGRRQVSAIPNFNQLHLVQKVEEWWKLVLESTKETWKGSSAQVATHQLCKCLLWSCLEGNAASPNHYLHSHIAKWEIDFHGFALVRSPSLCPEPGCGWNRKLLVYWKSVPDIAKFAFITAAKRSQFTKSVLHVCTVLFSEK